MLDNTPVIELPRDACSLLIQHAAQAYPRECCGIIVRSSGRLQVVPTQNYSAARNAFMLDPRALLKCRTQGLDIFAFYHSHPDAPAEMSEGDRTNLIINGNPAWPGVEQWILSVCKAQIVDLRRYVWKASSSAYVEIQHAISLRANNG